MDKSEIHRLDSPAALGLVVKLWAQDGKHHSIPVTGDSMLPLIQEDDRVLVAHGYAEIRPGDVIVFWQAGKLLIHRVIHVYGDRSSPAYLTKGDHAREFDSSVSAQEIIGKAVSIERRNRRISIDTPTWRILGWMIAIAARGEAWLLGLGSIAKQELLGPKPIRLSRILRQCLSMPFAFVFKILIVILSHRGEKPAARSGNDQE